MPDPRVEEPLSDAALDREIEELLGVEPSPEFVARVRTRVSGEAVRARLPWRGTWGMAAGLAMATVVATVLYVGQVARSGRADVPQMGRAGSAQGSVTRDPASVSPDSAGPVHRSKARQASAGPLPSRGPADVPRVGAALLTFAAETTAQPLVLPEVLISPAEQRALARLRVRQEPIETNGEPAIPSLPPVAAIEIPDIEVAPLKQIAALDIQGDLP